MEKLNKTPTHQLLGLTEHQYEKRVMELLLQWADLYGEGINERTQKLLISKSINKWFLAEYSKLLKEFKNCLKPYLNNKNITDLDKQLLWGEMVCKIFEVYPSALIKQIEKC